MSKFVVDAEDLSTEIQLLPPGYYAAEICNAGVDFKNGGSSIRIKEEVKWKNGDPIPTGKLLVGGNLSYGATVISEKAIKILQRDTPKVFGGRIAISIDPKLLKMKDCPPLGKLLKELDLKSVNFMELSGFQEDPDLVLEDCFDEEFPTDTENPEVNEINEKLRKLVMEHEDPIKLFNCLYAIRAYLGAIGSAMEGLRCRVKVKQEADPKSPEIKINLIDCGTLQNPFCGLIPYKEGSENDLDD